MIAEVCASKLGFSQRSTCRGFSFASLQVGFVVCPRRTAFSRLDMKNVSRSILPHLSEGPRCRPKVPAIQARGGKRERHRMMWGAKNTYHMSMAEKLQAQENKDLYIYIYIKLFNLSQSMRTSTLIARFQSYQKC